MSEETTKNIRIPAEGEEGKHTGQKLRAIVISSADGIKALYCKNAKKNITYLFAKSKGWTMDKGQAWMELHESILSKVDEIYIDQQEEFLKLVATFSDGKTEEWQPNSASFVLDKDKEDEILGLTYQDDEVADGMELLKVDTMKQIVYGVYLVPDKADHHGDVISSEDIEKVAHDFLVEYRTIDEMHKNVIAAEIVESSIAWKSGISYYGKKLKKGTWFGAIKINDKDVWQKVLDGEYKAFSVRIAGVREPIED